MTEDGLDKDFGQLSILIVEDEYYVAEDIARAVTDLGAQVLGPAPSHAEALKLLSNASRIDGAIVDINLQGNVDYAVPEALLERRVPFVFATGYDNDSLPSRFRHVPCWQKPFAPARLTSALLAMLARD